MSAQYLRGFKSDRRVSVRFLWSHVYRGIELVVWRRALWLGWTRPEYRERGW